ncbi:hypothetical protein [Sphingomonas profundi]|uniref:hypothetical protein n=1 Tax=Alterirhizorhabdus profundi TaxID=2681549 RepID=UPI0012E8FAFF|nr:hypothetical protein [Sphingomonas profundi]
MLSYKRLIDEHDQIAVTMRGLEHVCRTAIPAPVEASMLLLDLAAQVDEHLRHEDRAIYTDLIALQAEGKLTTLAIDLEAAFQELSRDWLNYLADWHHDAIAYDWRAFCEATAAMLPRVQTRVQTENDLIYPAALQAGTIRLKDVS